MNKRLMTRFAPLLALVLVGVLLLPTWAAASVDRMTKEELQKILTDADTVVLDVRQGRDWDSSEFKIQGARRADPGEIDTWSATLPKSATLVLYCA